MPQLKMSYRVITAWFDCHCEQTVNKLSLFSCHPENGWSRYQGLTNDRLMTGRASGYKNLLQHISLVVDMKVYLVTLMTIVIRSFINDSEGDVTAG